MIRIIATFLLAPIFGLLTTWGLFLILVTGSYEAILAMLVLAMYVYIPALIIGVPLYWLIYRYFTLSLNTCVAAAFATSILISFILSLATDSGSKPLSELMQITVFNGVGIFGLPAIISGALLWHLGFKPVLGSNRALNSDAEKTPRPLA